MLKLFMLQELFYSVGIIHNAKFDWIWENTALNCFYVILYIFHFIKYYASAQWCWRIYNNTQLSVRLLLNFSYATEYIVTKRGM